MERYKTCSSIDKNEMQTNTHTVLPQIRDSGRKIGEAIREKNIKDKKGEVGCMLLVDNEKLADLSESEAALKVTTHFSSFFKTLRLR